MQPDRTPIDYAGYRLQQAKECLELAEMALAADSFKGSANRSYYAIFHAMRAVLALDRFDSKKHSGVISCFRQNYIKTGIFDSKISDIVGDAFKVRNESDYEDFYIISKEKVTAQLENAKTFLTAIEDYLAPKLHDVSEKTQP